MKTDLEAATDRVVVIFLCLLSGAALVIFSILAYLAWRAFW